ncbi:hypothetical protein GA0115260_104671, partial [Streptomyces sp. MnatMP-M27]
LRRVGATSHDGAAVADDTSRPFQRSAQRIWTPERVRAMTRRWISLVPSKMV